MWDIEDIAVEKKYYPVAVGKIRDMIVTFTADGKDSWSEAEHVIRDWEKQYEILKADIDEYQGSQIINTWSVAIGISSGWSCPDT